MCIRDSDWTLRSAFGTRAAASRPDDYFKMIMTFESGSDAMTLLFCAAVPPSVAGAGACDHDFVFDSASATRKPKGKGKGKGSGYY